MTMQVLMLRNRMVDGVLLASGSTQTVSDEDGAYLVANEWATRTDGVPDRVISTNVAIPTIDPTTGALVDPTTGAVVLGTMSVMAPRVSPLCYGIRRADYTAAAALDAPNGVIGVLDSTPTAAESLAAQINIEFAADEYVWGLEINMPDTAGTLVDGLRVAIQPGDYVSASQILISAASAQRIDVAHNTSTIYEFRDADNNRAYVTALSMVWTPRAGGSGYPTKPLSIRGLANV